MRKRALYEWRIVRRRSKAELIGYVEAPDEQAALKAAIKKFGIPVEHQRRLMALPRDVVSA